MIELHCGDSVEVMKTLPDGAVHAVVVDPPYGLSDHRPGDVEACLRAWLAGEEFKPRKKGFMGRAWDAWVPGPEVFREALRVAKPGAYMLCFAGTRSMDLMGMSIRLAGWELCDGIGYAHDVADQIRAQFEHMDEEQLAVAWTLVQHLTGGNAAPLLGWTYGSGFPKNHSINLCSVEDRIDWSGWGTALKPAWEPIIIARRPMKGTVVANVLEHGTGAYNIDASRIPTDDELGGGAESGTTASQKGNEGWTRPWMADEGARNAHAARVRENVQKAESLGRWPANVIHDGSAAVLASFPDAPGAKGDVTGDEPSSATANVLNARARVPYQRHGEASADRRYGAGGNDGFAPLPGARREKADSAARFFYCAKTSAADRHEGLEHPGHQFAKGSTLRDAESVGEGRKGNHHPTVKPTALMRYLVKLVTPPGGKVLDFCCGSGSTGKACELDGFDFIGIDNDPESIRIAKARIGAGAPLFQEAA